MLQQIIWFCCGAPLVSARWLPGSQWRVQLLRLFGAHVGVGCRIKPGFRVKFPWRLRVGDHCWLGEDVWIDNPAEVRIGHHVCVSQGVYACTGNHDFRSPGFDLRLQPITIGDGAWIGAQARLAPGVVVGSDVVVCFGSVVLADIGAGTVVHGNPASHPRNRYPIQPEEDRSSQASTEDC